MESRPPSRLVWEEDGDKEAPFPWSAPFGRRVGAGGRPGRPSVSCSSISTNDAGAAAKLPSGSLIAPGSHRVRIEQDREQTTRFLGPFPKDVERRTATWDHARRSTHGTGFRSTYRAAVTDGPSVPSHGDTPRSDGTTRMHSVLLFSRESAVRHVTSSLVPCGSFERSDPKRIREETVCENVRSFTRLHSC